MKHSDDLFELVHALSRTEKKHLYFFLTRHSKNSRLVKLYNAISSQKKYNEPRLRIKLGYLKSRTGYSVVKHELYQTILERTQLSGFQKSLDNELSAAIAGAAYCGRN